VLVSTRSPGKRKALAARGVHVVFDNAGVAARAHLIVLAVLPSQLADAAKEVRKGLTEATVVVSLIAATSAPKLQQVLGKQAVLQAHSDVDLARQAGQAASEQRELLQLAARMGVPTLGAAQRLFGVLAAMLHGLELTAAEAHDIRMEALYGRLPAEERAHVALMLAPEAAGTAGVEAQDAANVGTHQAVTALRYGFVASVLPEMS
jgi:hypothetical protein